MRTLENLVEKLILGSRWILVVFYGGLGAALAVYAVSFVFRFVETVRHTFDLGESEMILAMLGMIDAALVASLIVMVMISSYENFVSRFDEAKKTELSWLGKLDSGTLKIKVASSIVAISSIHLLQVFLNVEQYADDKIAWSLGLHLTFVASALLLGYLERISANLKP